MSNFHVHMTTSAPVDPPKGWKRTDIVLEGDRVQTDFMLTKHYQIGKKGIKTINDILNDAILARPSNCFRVKLEQDSGFSLQVTELLYAEIHMLCPSGVEPKSSGWVKSKNPRRSSEDGGEYFYNKRVYSAESMEALMFATLREEITTEYVDIKFEHVIYDSNRHHDAWWA